MALAIGLFSFASPAPAHAFQLVAPPPWIVEGPDGTPQVAGPCGADISVCYQPTGALTTFTAGQEIRLEWVETAPSDGWFRIALSYTDRSDLTDPAVVLDDAGVATDASVFPPVDPDAAPLGITTYALPVLADGLFAHVAADIPGVPYRYTWNVVLPDKPCDKCTLQVTQFLAGNKSSSGYFAHHCADIAILPVVDVDAAADPHGRLALPDDAGGPSVACAVPDAGMNNDAPHAVDAGAVAVDTGAVAASGSGESAGGDAAEDAGGGGSGSSIAPAASAKSNGGCGCRVAADDSPAALFGLGLVTALAALARRRYRPAR